MKIFSIRDSCSKLIVLIDGATGVGKTTLCKRIAQNWSKGVVPALNHYQIVLLVHLREASDAQDVDDLFNLYICRSQNHLQKCY